MFHIEPKEHSAAPHPLESQLFPRWQTLQLCTTAGSSCVPTSLQSQDSKFEVQFLWDRCCFHAGIKPESVSDRYTKTILKTWDNISSSQSWQPFSVAGMSSLSFPSYRLPKFFFYKQGFNMLFSPLGTVCDFILVQGTSHVPGKRAAPETVWTVIWCVRFLLSWLCNWQWHFVCLGLFFLNCSRNGVGFFSCIPAELFCRVFHSVFCSPENLGIHCWTWALQITVQKRWLRMFNSSLPINSTILQVISRGLWYLLHKVGFYLSHFGFLVLEENHSLKNFSWFTVQTNKSIGFEFHVWLWVTLLRKVIWVEFSCLFPSESWLSSS